MYRYLLLTAALFVTAPATAQMFGRGGDIAATFDKADADHDGMITRAEFIAARSSRFPTMDRNGDGVVSKADFGRLARFKPEAATRLDTVIAQADANHDGRVTQAELAAAPAPIFDRIDTDHDGSINKAELAAGKAAIAAFRDRDK